MTEALHSISPKETSQSVFLPKVVVFATNLQAQYVIAYLSQKQYLAGVIVPDPSELGEQAIEANQLVMQLQQSGIPFQCCCQEKLTLIDQQLAAWQVNLGVIVGFPYILPKMLIEFFVGNIFNFHAAKLPKYPGPRPLYWQIRQQEKETAITLHRAELKVDSGNIIVQRIIAINELDTLASLTHKIAHQTPSLLIELIDALVITGELPSDYQQTNIAVMRAEQKDLLNEYAAIDYARRPTSQDYTVDFNEMSAAEISAMARAGNGLSYSALIHIKNIPVNIMQATPVDYPTYGTKPGTVLFIGEPEGLIVGVKGSALRLDILACTEGIFSGLAFAEYFHLDAGEVLSSTSVSLLKQHG
jgi:methionyl-tRNA formyltransferase